MWKYPHNPILEGRGIMTARSESLEWVITRSRKPIVISVSLTRPSRKSLVCSVSYYISNPFGDDIEGSVENIDCIASTVIEVVRKHAAITANAEEEFFGPGRWLEIMITALGQGEFFD